jgi:hypothetical protein
MGCCRCKAWSAWEADVIVATHLLTRMPFHLLLGREFDGKQ